MFSKPVDEDSSTFATFIDIPEAEEQYAQVEDVSCAASAVSIDNINLSFAHIIFP
jgi:hypothetical protein